MQYTPSFPGIWGFNVLLGLRRPDVHLLCRLADGNNHFISFEQRGVGTCTQAAHLVEAASHEHTPRRDVAAHFPEALRRLLPSSRISTESCTMHSLRSTSLDGLGGMPRLLDGEENESRCEPSAPPQPRLEVNLTSSSFNFFAPSRVIAIRLSEKFT